LEEVEKRVEAEATEHREREQAQLWQARKHSEEAYLRVAELIADTRQRRRHALLRDLLTPPAPTQPQRRDKKKKAQSLSPPPQQEQHQREATGKRPREEEEPGRAWWHHYGKQKNGKGEMVIQVNSVTTDGQQIIGDSKMSVVFDVTTLDLQHHLHVLGDQGSQGSIIGESAYLKAFAHIPLRPLHTPVSVTTGMGHQERALGAVDLEWRMGGHVFRHPVLVVKSFKDMFLLGIDFFNQHRWTKPDGLRDYYVFDDRKKVPFRTNAITLGEQVNVVIGRDLVIEPRTCVTTLARLSNTVSSAAVRVGTAGVFSPLLTRRLRHRLTSSDTVCCALEPKAAPDPTWSATQQALWGSEEDACRIPILLSNHGDHPVTIKANTKVGDEVTRQTPIWQPKVRLDCSGFGEDENPKRE
jgi:hypothetical protein